MKHPLFYRQIDSSMNLQYGNTRKNSQFKQSHQNNFSSCSILLILLTYGCTKGITKTPCLLNKRISISSPEAYKLMKRMR